MRREYSALFGHTGTLVTMSWYTDDSHPEPVRFYEYRWNGSSITKNISRNKAAQHMHSWRRAYNVTVVKYHR